MKGKKEAENEISKQQQQKSEKNVTKETNCEE